MTESKDETAASAAPSAAPTPVTNEAAHMSTPVTPGQGMDQLTNLMSHPKVKGILGKSIKAVAFMAILGCLLLYGAITALSNILNSALPH